MTNYLGEFYNQAQYNKNSTILDAWRPDNTDTDIPRVTLDDPNNNIRPSTYYIHNASFVRLKNLKVGYTLPDKVASKLKLKRTYIYLQGQNLFTITGYEGIDPEVGLQSYSSENRNLDMGVDRGVYPLPRTFTLGLTLVFNIKRDIYNEKIFYFAASALMMCSCADSFLSEEPVGEFLPG